MIVVIVMTMTVIMMIGDDGGGCNDGGGYKSTGEMPGPISTGSMVRTLPGAFLPCAEQYGHHDDRDDHGSHGDHNGGDHDLGDSSDRLGGEL